MPQGQRPLQIPLDWQNQMVRIFAIRPNCNDGVDFAMLGHPDRSIQPCAKQHRPSIPDTSILDCHQGWGWLYRCFYRCLLHLLLLFLLWRRLPQSMAVLRMSMHRPKTSSSGPRTTDRSDDDCKARMEGDAADIVVVDVVVGKTGGTAWWMWMLWWR